MIGLVVPALDPSADLPDLFRALREAVDDCRIVLVDDGSSDRSVLESCATINSVLVLHHAANQGKGAALKTGFRELLEDRRVSTIVTVDADGQHLPADVARVCSAALARPRMLILGSRQFSGDVPFKSSLGNRLTRRAVKLISDLDLTDTQTGLRAVPRDFARRVLSIASDRYALEMEMLIVAKQEALDISEVEIATVYIDDNQGTHFRPVRDSIAIYMIFRRFSTVSLLSFILDIALFAVFHYFTGMIPLSTYLARVASGTFNFLGSRRVVFSQTLLRHGLGYLTLAFAIATVSALSVQFLVGVAGWGATPTKILVDPCLFALSFLGQRLVVFRR